MALDREALKDAFRTAFDTAKEEGWSTEQVAEAFAVAIETFVRGGEVVNITTKVEVDLGTGRGEGIQTGAGEIQ